MNAQKKRASVRANTLDIEDFIKKEMGGEGEQSPIVP